MPEYLKKINRSSVVQRVIDRLTQAMLSGELKPGDKIPTEFYCNCSKERVSRAVISVGKKELADMIEEGKPIEVNCHLKEQKELLYVMASQKV